MTSHGTVFRTIFPLVAMLLGMRGQGQAAAPAQPASSPALAGRGLCRYVYSVHPDGSQSSGPGGGQGIVVVDMDDQFRFVKRIALPPRRRVEGVKAGSGAGMRGIAAHRGTGRLYYCWHGGGGGNDGVGCVDLKTDRIVWERYYDFTADRVQVSLDGKHLFVPVHWTDTAKRFPVLDAATGEVVRQYETSPSANKPKHPFVLHPDGRRVFWPGTAFDLQTGAILWTNSNHQDTHYVLNREGTRLFTGRCNPKDGAFYMVDVLDGKMTPVPIDRTTWPDLGGVMEVGSFTPDGRRFWAEANGPSDTVNGMKSEGNGRFMVQFDITVNPPAIMRVVDRNDLIRKHGYRPMGHGHGHAMVSGAGDYAWFSHGIVLDAHRSEFVCVWTAEGGKPFQSAKHVEVNYLDGEIIWAAQDEGHGYIYNDYPINKVRPLLPAGSPRRRLESTNPTGGKP